MDSATKQTRESIETLAKLMATENINVIFESGKFEAYFELSSRTLKLPVYDGMTVIESDLLVGHEIGHALYTPHMEWIKAVDKKKQQHRAPVLFKTVMNVVEDARIERLVKNRYPGMRRIFSRGYDSLYARGAFSGMGSNPKLRLLEELNLSFKSPNNIIPQRTPEFNYFEKEMEKCVTFQDVLRVSEELHAHLYNELSTEDSDESSEGKNKKKDNNKKKKENKKQKPENEQQESESGQGNTAKPEKEEQGEEESVNSNGGGDSSDSEEGEGSSSSDSDSSSSGSQDNKEEDDGEEGTDEGVGDLSKDYNGEAEEDEEGEDDESEGNSTNVAIKDGAPKKGKPTNDFVDIDQEITTVQSFERFLRQSAQEASGIRTSNIELPWANMDNIVVSWETILRNVLRDMKGEDGETVDAKGYLSTYKNFLRKTAPSIGYYTKVFRMKKSAKEQKRVFKYKTGVLNVNQLHKYKLSDDIFRTNTTTFKGKNHGLVLYLDMSGSMGSIMHQTIMQMVELVLFCAENGIPVAGYGFTDHNVGGVRSNQFQNTTSFYNTGGFNLIEFFSPEMNRKQINQMINWMLIASSGVRSRFKHSGKYLMLGGTPLLPAVLTIPAAYDRLKKQTNAQIVNVVFLTDGGDTSLHYVMEQKLAYSLSGSSEQYLNIVDNKTKHRHFEKIGRLYESKRCSYNTVIDDRLISSILTCMKSFLGDNVSVLNYLICTGMGAPYYRMTPGFAGFDEYFLIDQNCFKNIGKTFKDHIEEDYLEDEQKLSLKEVQKIFSNVAVTRKEQQKIINRFIEMIA